MKKFDEEENEDFCEEEYFLKLKYSSSQKSSFSFSSNLFIATATFLDLGIVGLTENVSGHLLAHFEKSRTDKPIRKNNYFLPDIHDLTRLESIHHNKRIQL